MLEVIRVKNKILYLIRKILGVHSPSEMFMIKKESKKVMGSSLYCSLHPLKYVCTNCLNSQVDAGVILSCNDCIHNKKRYKVLKIGVGIFGSKAVILDNGSPITVDMSRIYNIKKESKNGK